MRPVAEILRSSNPQDVAEALHVPPGVLRSAIATGLIDGLLWLRIQKHMAQHERQWTDDPWEYIEGGIVACPVKGSVLLDVCYRNYTQTAAKYGKLRGCATCTLGADRRADRAVAGYDILDMLQSAHD